MRLVTLRGTGPDGRLAVVSRDLSSCVFAPEPFCTMQGALERWSEAEPALRALSRVIDEGHTVVSPFRMEDALAPLPRAWQWLDGSAFLSHSALMCKVFGVDDVADDVPLMYQGVSHRFLAPTEAAPFRSEDDGIDFEGEFGIITDATPAGIRADVARRHIRLLVLVNDWSLRALAPREMKTGFGWLHSKPPCSVAPLAVTPDEIGTAWLDSRVALPLHVELNGSTFGDAHGGAMNFGFNDLVAHAAATRDLCAGTIIGSGTVSNVNCREVGSCCIAERRGIEILEAGAPGTGYMRFGDRVRMEAFDAKGRSVFGAIDQIVVPFGGRDD